MIAAYRMVPESNRPLNVRSSHSPSRWDNSGFLDLNSSGGAISETTAGASPQRAGRIDNAPPIARIGNTTPLFWIAVSMSAPTVLLWRSSTKYVEYETSPIALSMSRPRTPQMASVTVDTENAAMLSVTFAVNRHR